MGPSQLGLSSRLGRIHIALQKTKETAKGETRQKNATSYSFMERVLLGGLNCYTVWYDSFYFMISLGGWVGVSARGRASHFSSEPEFENSNIERLQRVCYQPVAHVPQTVLLGPYSAWLVDGVPVWCTHQNRGAPRCSHVGSFKTPLMVT